MLKIISRSAFDLQPVLGALIESATRLCGATRGHVFQFDGEYLRFAAAYGAWSGFAEHLESHPLRPGPGSIAGRAASERRTIHSQDVLKETGYEFIDLIKQQGYRTVLAVPMLREGVLRGVITILKTNVEPFTDKQIEMVETFAVPSARRLRSGMSASTALKSKVFTRPLTIRCASLSDRAPARARRD